MSDPSLVVLTGPPGAGKTTVARHLAVRWEKSACIEADWFWTTIARGFLPPWEHSAAKQNQVVIRSVTAAAGRMTIGGYSTVVEGIIGPWYLDIITEELRDAGVAIDYVILRPDLDTCLDRAKGRAGEERVPGHPALTDEGPIRALWKQFSNLASGERHVVDNSGLTAEEATEIIWRGITTGAFRLAPG